MFYCGLRAECSDTSFYTVSIKESSCHLQQHKKLLVMCIARTKVPILIFSKFQIIFSWPFLCFFPKKNPYSFPWLKCLWEASPIWLPAAVFQNCRSLSMYGSQNISLGKIPGLFAKYEFTLPKPSVSGRFPQHWWIQKSSWRLFTSKQLKSLKLLMGNSA